MHNNNDVVNPGESRRPALRKLINDISDIRSDLRTGFDSRRDVLRWSQRLTVRTLGEMPQYFYHELARQFRGSFDSEEERVLLSTLLTEHARERDLDPDAVMNMRNDIEAVLIIPATNRAFRQLRKDAGEYMDADSDTVSGHDPAIQRFVAMRPAIDELAADQTRCLDLLLNGFRDPAEIIDWTEHVELATHGEIPPGFLGRCYREPSTRGVLTGTGESYVRARELFAATYLIPWFNKGVRDLAGHTGEAPDADKSPQEAKPA